MRYMLNFYTHIYTKSHKLLFNVSLFLAKLKLMVATSNSIFFIYVRIIWSKDEKRSTLKWAHAQPSDIIWYTYNIKFDIQPNFCCYSFILLVVWHSQARMENIKTYFTKFVHPIALCCFTQICCRMFTMRIFSVDASYFLVRFFLAIWFLFLSLLLVNLNDFKLFFMVAYKIRWNRGRD